MSDGPRRWAIRLFIETIVLLLFPFLKMSSHFSFETVSFAQQWDCFLFVLSTAHSLLYKMKRYFHRCHQNVLISYYVDWREKFMCIKIVWKWWRKQGKELIYTFFSPSHSFPLWSIKFKIDVNVISIINSTYVLGVNLEVRGSKYVKVFFVNANRFKNAREKNRLALIIFDFLKSIWTHSIFHRYSRI